MTIRAIALRFLALACACSWIGAAAASAAAGFSFGDLRFQPCTLSAPAHALTVAARCATLRVPEDRARPQGRTIELAIAWVPSSAKKPSTDPVFMLAGGPGQSALDSFPMVAVAFSKVRERRHVVLVDQRGTGRSQPLKCPQTMGADAMREIELESADPAVAKRLTSACLAELVDVDPSQYTTTRYIEDLEDVRRALHVDSVNLVGVSYGTRVALEYLRRHPSSIRTLVLDSIVPPTLILGADHARNLEDAVNRQFDRCTADVACRDRFGSPRAQLDALLQRLRDQPQVVSYRDPLTHELREDRLTADAVAGVVRLHAYAPQLFSMLPMLLAAAAEGRYEPLMAQSRMIEQLVGEQISIPLQLSVSCAEDVPWLQTNPADRGTLIGSDFVDFMRAQCAVWPRGAMPQDFHAPLVSQHPALLMSGEFDPVTPPRYGELVHRMLPRSRHVVLRGQGHSVMGIGCTPRLIGEFIARADATSLDTSCLDRLTYTAPFTGPYGWDP